MNLNEVSKGEVEEAITCLKKALVFFQENKPANAHVQLVHAHRHIDEAAIRIEPRERGEVTNGL